MHAVPQAETAEVRFQRFSSDLLAAEEIGFRGEFLFYSPETLAEILKRFCSIIADNLHGQSCTVQLKLYDTLSPGHLRELFDRGSAAQRLKSGPDGQELWKVLSAEYDKRWQAALGRHHPEFRQELLTNLLIFPYALYPKGAARLVAASHGSPWLACAGWLVSELRGGITTEIVQEKAARVRDRMSIRKTRSQRKLGPHDPYIWTNQMSELGIPLYFFNYYGVPIRIHQGGDVIGILRVENKGLAASSPLVRDLLRSILDLQLGGLGGADELADKLYDLILDAKLRMIKSTEFRPSDPSLLSVVYLAHDLTAVKNWQSFTVGDLCTLPYRAKTGDGPEARTDRKLRMLHDRRSRPPVQITFDTVEEEYAFLDWLCGAEVEDAPSPGAFEAAKTFYKNLKDKLRGYGGGDTIDDDIRKSIEGSLTSIGQRPGAHSLHCTLTLKPVEKEERLLREVQIDIPGASRFRFHIQVTPSHSEAEDQRQLMVYWGLSEESALRYQHVNSGTFPAAAEEWEFHGPTDSIAARVQALAFAFPIPEFTINDAWWLSWAALEIGKLVERQISYRGTNVVPTVPLTAIDFFRVPISDLSFVDSLRAQHSSAEAVKGMLQYHIPNRCRELEMDTNLEHHYRIKDFRSYLERLGQEHRANYDALVSTWLYILSRRLDQNTAQMLRVSLQKYEADALREYIPEELRDSFSTVDQYRELCAQTLEFIDALRDFTKALEAVCDRDTVLFTDDEIDWLQKHGDKTLGDLKFEAPDPHLSNRDLDVARSVVLKNLQESPQAAAGAKPVQIGHQQIAEFIFRRYDPFATWGISLYILLTNLIDPETRPFGVFYDKCRRLTESLRGKYQASHELHEQFQHTGLIDKLEQLRTKVFLLSTSHFCSVLRTTGALSETQAEEACLTIRGIYKRIRTLVNIASNQMSPPLLNWEASRFDYVGARVNCLFKNQVFAIYEHLWNRSDPFSHWHNDRPEGGHPSHDDTSRLRWLSIRTKIHTGQSGYNAWQITALMDAKAIGKGHWSKATYNLRELRNYLVLSFDRWHLKAAEEYRKLSALRHGWQKDYCNWFGHIRQILRGERLSADRAQQVFWPEYILRTPFDIFVRLLESEEARKEDFLEVVTLLLNFNATCSQSSGSASLSPIAQRIYDKAEEVSRAQYLNSTLQRLLRGQLSFLAEEKERFRVCDFDPPTLKAFADSRLKSRLTELHEVMTGHSSVNEVWRKALQYILIRVQGMQKQYLFDFTEEDHPRDSRHVMDRILCYVLLFSPALGNKVGTRNPFKTWSAYDLFYYLVSLVPVEIQVRTALADTMAEQYHGVYKTSADPSDDIAVQRWRLEEIGRKLGALDDETEGQYESLILHTKRTNLQK
jgi:hypothetical protein